MKQILSLFLFLFCQISWAQDQDIKYIKKGEASVQVIGEGSKFTYRTIETKYLVPSVSLQENDLDVNYLAKFRIETLATIGNEGQDRTIQVDIVRLDQPDKILFTTKKECDALELHSGFFKTIKYGCCSDLTRIKLFDYQNREIIAGSEKINAISFATKEHGFYSLNEVGMYVAYAHNGLDSKDLGQITISYRSGERFDIKVLSNQPISEDCPNNLADIEIVTKLKVKKGDLQNHELVYDIYSPKNIDSYKDINDVTLQIKYPCDKSIKSFTIPIINGLPFGKDQKSQSINVFGQ